MSNGVILVVYNSEQGLGRILESQPGDSYSIEYVSDCTEAHDAVFMRGMRPDLVLMDTNCDTSCTCADFVSALKKEHIPVVLLNTEGTINAKVAELTARNDRMIESMATVIEYRHLESAMHIKRIKAFAALIVERALKHPKFKHDLLDMDYEAMIRAFPLHDVGKIAVPDTILLKPGKLTEVEMEIIKTHPVVGGDVIKTVLEFGQMDGFSKHCYDIAAHHHERWDGTGYPGRLSGEDIPLSARIMSVADVYDALTTKRVYKDAVTHEVAMDIMKKGAGEQFDPDLIDILTEIEDEFHRTAQNLKDPD
jgi:putative two-component system response regulator